MHGRLCCSIGWQLCGGCLDSCMVVLLRLRRFMVCDCPEDVSHSSHEEVEWVSHGDIIAVERLAAEADCARLVESRRSVR